MHTAIGTYIRERRQDLGLSQEQVAERMGGNYGQSDISRLERGLVELPRLGTMTSLAAALEVPVGDLLIASGWFNDGHFAQHGGGQTQNSLDTALNEIDAQLATIHDLEREAKSRSDRLRTMIRDLKVTSGVRVMMTEHQPRA